MHSNREVVKQVLIRAELRRWKRAVVQWLVAIVTVATGSIVAVALVIHQDFSHLQPMSIDSPYGSLMFAGSGIGGYILVGVIALTAGVVLTILCLKLAERLRKKERDGET